jgi:hypothetical protein
VSGLGVCFLLTATFFTVGGIAVLTWPAARLRRHALLAGAVVIGAVYSHYAFSRADLAHLAPSIHPLLLGLAALPTACAAASRRPAAARAMRWTIGATIALLLAAITCVTAVPAHPLYHQLTTEVMQPYTVAGEHLLLRPRVIELLDWVERMAASRIPPKAPILLAPILPGLYPILGRRSPVWDIYPIWPAEGWLDDRMLNELRDHHVEWAIVQNAAVDARDDLLFRNTHPQTWEYLMTNFDLEAALRPAHPWQCALLHRLPPAAAPPPLRPKSPIADPHSAGYRFNPDHRLQ